MDEQVTTLAVVAAGFAVAKPIAESGSRLIENLMGEPCKVAGGMLADQLYRWQWTNRIKIAHRAQEIMSRDGIAAKVLPPGFLLHFIDACGNVEEADLQELWANLLASGAKDTLHQKVAFLIVLKELSVEEARVLRLMRQKAHDWEQAESLPEKYEGECTSVEVRDFLGVNHSRAVFVAHSLIRLGLIAECSIDQTRRLADRNTKLMEYMLTVFGSEFADACMGFPSPPEQPEPLEHSKTWKHRS